jgi:hypothetical protein
MGLSWINPLYLSGLLLLALPVLIHLVQKQHSQGMRFPSLMFLKQIPQREKRRLEIRQASSQSARTALSCSTVPIACALPITGNRHAIRRCSWWSRNRRGIVSGSY